MQENKSQIHQKSEGLSESGVTWLGLFANLLLAIAKGLAGFFANSAALIADSGHSLSDLLSDGVTLWAVRMTKQPKDEKHPYGHGKFETVGTFLVALLLIVTGVGIAWHVVTEMEEPVVPGQIALWVAGLSIAVKEGLFHITQMVGKRTGSRVLMANAWHHRSDGISSIAALIGIAGTQAGIPLMDPIAGVLVSGLIIKTGIDIGYESIKELTDETVEEEVIQELDEIMSTIKGVVKYHEMRARRMGPNLLVDLHVQVDSMTSVSAAHQVAERVRWKILKSIPAVNEVLVHLDAEDDTENQFDMIADKLILMRPQEEIEKDVRESLSRIPEIENDTFIQCHYLNQKLQIQACLNLNQDIGIQQTREIFTKAKLEIEKIEDVDEAELFLDLK